MEKYYLWKFETQKFRKKSKPKPQTVLNLVFVFIIIGLTTTCFAQDESNEFEVTLDDVEVLDTNYNYLNAIGYMDAAVPVKLLAQKAASFDLEYSNFLKADYEKLEYYVQYKIPEGEIIVVYDNEGQIIRTSEMFIDISLPLAVSNAIVKKYPGSLLAMLFSAMKRPVAPAVPMVKGKPDSLAPYRFVKNHFWDDVLFNDYRLLRTPFFESKLDEYYTILETEDLNEKMSRQLKDQPVGLLFQLIQTGHP